jgi:hypothetical protein
MQNPVVVIGNNELLIIMIYLNYYNNNEIMIILMYHNVEINDNVIEYIIIDVMN